MENKRSRGVHCASALHTFCCSEFLVLSQKFTTVNKRHLSILCYYYPQWFLRSYRALRRPSQRRTWVTSEQVRVIASCAPFHIFLESFDPVFSTKMHTLTTHMRHVRFNRLNRNFVERQRVELMEVWNKRSVNDIRRRMKWRRKESKKNYITTMRYLCWTLTIIICEEMQRAKKPHRRAVNDKQGRAVMQFQILTTSFSFWSPPKNIIGLLWWW